MRKDRAKLTHSHFGITSSFIPNYQFKRVGATKRVSVIFFEHSCGRITYGSLNWSSCTACLSSSLSKRSRRTQALANSRSGQFSGLSNFCSTRSVQCFHSSPSKHQTTQLRHSNSPSCFYSMVVPPDLQRQSLH